MHSARSRCGGLNVVTCYFDLFDCCCGGCGIQRTMLELLSHGGATLRLLHHAGMLSSNPTHPATLLHCWLQVIMATNGIETLDPR